MTDDIRAQLAAIAERLSAVERAVNSESSAGTTRGEAQHKIGERVAVLETSQAHVLKSVESLTTRVNAATVGSVGGAGAVIWALLQSGLLGGGG